ncbi:GIY-YIG nuclease family protein [Ulvibacter antarcticus]|uniref:GIY-YIG catalytic domain-containing protein n=1 Tax=Ulvibacter antarcticus TaxID=442714 RepID=A0A3L9Z880_9FLAO|nr:GIY-YIG nuclease family protein [Ulvibacter antarcticus]RMA67709.1 GIY-YIG catalytic domain-containing protein [Ulvibacter antarcticus]
MNLNKPSKELLDILHLTQEKLLTAERIKFEKNIEWRRKMIPDGPGIYALFEKNNKLLYIGESGSLRERMGEINRTVNHSFRKQIDHIRFNGVKSSKKYNSEVETKLDKFFDEEIYVSFVEVYFGRLEIEEFMISNHQMFLTNSFKKRKFKTVMDYLRDFK